MSSDKRNLTVITPDVCYSLSNVGTGDDVLKMKGCLAASLC